MSGSGARPTITQLTPGTPVLAGGGAGSSTRLTNASHEDHREVSSFMSDWSWMSYAAGFAGGVTATWVYVWSVLDKAEKS